jgi:hypothetical protein
MLWMNSIDPAVSRVVSDVTHENVQIIPAAVPAAPTVENVNQVTGQ